MRRNIITIGVFVVLSAVASFVIYYSNNPCYKPALKMSGLTVSCHQDDTIRIAYIGDSWAERHKNVKCIIDSQIQVQTGRPVVVRNAGVGGLISKDIYYSIFNNPEFRDVIEWGPNFCFISAGINDTNKKSGSNNYKDNMRLLICLLLECNVTPLILEIPYYDICYTFMGMSPMTMLRSIRSMIWTLSSINCIDAYSNTYNDLIEEQQWEKSVYTIRRNDWNSTGYKGRPELYNTDRMHLNQEGYFVLDSCIASHILRYIMKKDSTWKK
jgi:lysophospholipase L1-like esterase